MFDDMSDNEIDAGNESAWREFRDDDGMYDPELDDDEDSPFWRVDSPWRGR